MESHMKRHADREGLYQLRMQVGIVLTLLLLIVLARSDIAGNEQEEQFQAAVAYMPVMLVRQPYSRRRSFRRHQVYQLLLLTTSC